MADTRAETTERYREEIVPVLERFPEIERVVLFGSRAKETARSGADIDLALEGSDLHEARLPAIYNAIDDLLLPVKVDLLLLGDRTKPELREHIERVGIVWYAR